MNESRPSAIETRFGPPRSYWLIPLAVVLLRAIPFLATRLATPPPGTVYPPIGYNPIDWFAYAGFVRQAAETGDWLLFNPHTTLPQDGRYFLPLFSLLGAVCRATGLTPFAALEIARVPLVFAFFAVLWRFVGEFLPDRRQRMLAALLVAFAGGVEFLAHATVSWWPLQWHRPIFGVISDDQGWSTFALLNNPLSAAGLTLMLLALRPILKPAGGRVWKEAVRTGAWTVITFLVHPYSGIGVLAISAGVLLVRVFPPADRMPAFRLATGVSVAFLVIAGVSAWQNQDAVFHATARGFFGARNAPVWWYPLTLGATGVLAAQGAWQRWRAGAPETRTFLAWGTVAALLHTSPWTNGYHFVFLVHLPLCLLAAPALDLWLRVFDDEHARMSRQFGVALLVALSFQSALAVTWRTTRMALAYAIPTPAMDAIHALGREPASRVYTSPHLGAILPSYSSHRVVVGHWFLTPNHSRLQARFNALMAGAVPADELLTELLRDRVRFVLLPPGAPIPVIDALRSASLRVEPFDRYRLFQLR